MKRSIVMALFALATGLFAPAGGQENDSEKLFRGMEKKIKGAKAFQVVFTYQLEGKTAKGSLLATSDNKARLEVRGPFHFGVKHDAGFVLVSDGKQITIKGAKFVISTVGRIGVELGGQMEHKTPKTFHAALVASLSRGGIGATVLGLPYVLVHEIDPDAEESKMKTYDFQAAVAEKVGERQAKVIRYRYGKGGNDDPELTLWLDAESGLPLQRVLVLRRGENIRIREAYSEFKLNPKIDAKAFEPPK